MVEKRLEAIMYQGGRLPPAHFPPLTLLKILFRKMKVLSRRNTDDCLFQMWNFLISAKKSSIHVQKILFFQITPFELSSTSNFPPIQIFRNSSFFKNNLFFSNPNLVRFEKFPFSRILQQICYNLVTTFLHGQNRRASDTFTSDIIDWRNRKKNVRFE